jgi:hypothetical protein
MGVVERFSIFGTNAMMPGMIDGQGESDATAASDPGGQWRHMAPLSLYPDDPSAAM